MTTPLEAYLTGIVFVSLTNTDTPLPGMMRSVTMFDDQGQVNGIIQVQDLEGNVRASIYIQEHPRE